MHVVSFRLCPFRNHPLLSVEPAPGLNLILGPNGSGKSNLLEALSVLSAGESFRGAETKLFFPWEGSRWAADGMFEGEEPIRVEVSQEKNRPRQLKMNRISMKRLSDQRGRIPLVSFSPEELDLVKGEPALRRRALNEVLAQTDAAYAQTLDRYEDVLEQRNAALRRLREGQHCALEPWDRALLKEGAFLSLRRQKFLAAWGPPLADQYARLSRGQEPLTSAYKPSFLLPSDNLEEVMETAAARLKTLREGEIALGSSLIGPHRDDVEFLLSEKLARSFASQGQSRTVTLAWKLAERAYMENSLGRTPLCIWDDVLSELDPTRRQRLAEQLTDIGQCFVTLTHPEDWPGSPAQGRWLTVGRTP